MRAYNFTTLKEVAVDCMQLCGSVYMALVPFPAVQQTCSNNVTMILIFRTQSKYNFMPSFLHHTVAKNFLTLLKSYAPPCHGTRLHWDLQPGASRNYSTTRTSAPTPLASGGVTTGTLALPASEEKPSEPWAHLYLEERKLESQPCLDLKEHSTTALRNTN